MKLFKLFFLLNALLISLASFAQIFPPYPTPGTTPIYYGIYPVSIEVPYGKTSASPKTYQLQYYIVNQTSNTYTISDFNLTAVNPPSTNPITVTSYTTQCGGVNGSKTLGPSGSTGVCNIFANISAVNNSNNPMTMAFDFKYTSGRSKATQAAPNFTISFATGTAIASAARTVSFVNNCSYAVWFGIDSGAVDSITPDPSVTPKDLKSCVDTVNSTDCYKGSVCRQVQAKPTVLNHCLWENPAPTGAGNPFHLLANNGSGTIQVQFPAYDNGIETAWNGGIAGRVGCSDSAPDDCTIADCGANPSGTACPVPSGFATPSTLAEFTFLTQNPVITATSGTPASDTYDITVINGVTVPTSMKPTTVAWGGNSAPYTCGEPGAKTLPAGNTQLGACTWFSTLPPTNFPGTGLGSDAKQDDFVWVATLGGGGTCTGTISGDSCTVGGQVCGHTISGATVSTGLVCGAPLGYLTADAVCAIDKNFEAPFYCTDSTYSVYENGSTYTLNQIYGCSVGDFSNSCYSSGNSACCGCENWNTFTTVPSSTQSCAGISNSNWQNALITSKFLPWLKQLCPTAYTYPFDDASSTFTCQDTDANNNNVVDYTVTFCPI